MQFGTHIWRIPGKRPQYMEQKGAKTVQQPLYRKLKMKAIGTSNNGMFGIFTFSLTIT
jgi:hypothetical protein